MTDTLEAGRELDALIAERVMGYVWRRSSFTFGSPPHHARLLMSPTTAATFHDGELHGDEADDKAFDRVSCYSEDIASAFLVVAEMHKRLAAYGTSLPGEVAEPWPDANYLDLVCCGAFDGWAASFVCHDAMIGDDLGWYEQPEKGRGARGETAAHAICLASLKAIESLASPQVET